MTTFGENLKRIRKSRKMTQAELASAAGLDRTTICKYERVNSPKPTTDALCRFIEVLGCTAEELLGKPTTVIEIIVKINGKEVMRWQSTDTE